MSTILTDALLQSARVARDFLTPLAALNPASLKDPPVASLSQDLQARIDAARDEILEYHRTHRPPNTARNYAPSQREWKA